MCLIIVQHRLFAVIFVASVGFLHCQTIRERILRSCGVIFQIVYLFVTDRLNGRVLGGFNRETAVVQRLVRLSFCVSQLVDKILNYLVGKGIHKIRCHVLLFRLGIYHLDSVIHVVFHGAVIFPLGNVTQL